jgi:hypothetical protein
MSDVNQNEQDNTEQLANDPELLNDAAALQSNLDDPYWGNHDSLANDNESISDVDRALNLDSDERETGEIKD